MDLVDGEPFHPLSCTVEDHRQDRLVRAYGILMVEHFEARECREHPEQAVRWFLEILRWA